MATFLLIYPPLAKNCEPPAGIARLTGFLRGNDVSCVSLDANRLGLDFLLSLDFQKTDTWSARARKNLAQNITALKNTSLYLNFDRYKRAVADLNRVLTGVGENCSLDLSLANYQDRSFSPVQSYDLLRVAEDYKKNIFYPFYEDKIARELEKTNPVFLGISISYLSQAIPAFSLIGFIRARFPWIKIILGGGLITSWMRSPAWKEPFSGLVTQCISGAGELPLLKMAGKKAGQGIPAPPEYDFFDYFSPGGILPYAASSGCYWNKCLFCPETAEDNPYIAIPPQQVLAELKTLLARKKAILIHFLDNALSPALLKALVENPPGTPWYGFARVSSLLADREFCQKLRKSGCLMLKLGLESGDQNVLDQMKKGIKLDMVSKALKALKSAGITTYIYLLFGTPSEDEKSAKKTMDFTIRHHHEIGFLNIAVFNLPLASPEVSTLKVNEFYDGDLSLYTDFIHPKDWSRRKIRIFLSKEFKRHPAIAPIIQRDPPFFTSNHAPLFLSAP
jgi:hypothetical protein